MAQTRKTEGETRRPLLAFYGDDFTGSTDALEALARAGVKTALFLKPPGARELRRFPGLQAFGVAGTSRTMSPQEMEQELPGIFLSFKKSGAPVVHYKICSTFDSSPRIGSIGKAIELGDAIFPSRYVPLVVGAPFLGRWCAFGNLFARSGIDSEPCRLDRHPTMSCHPVTPMKEADPRLHLAKQTRMKTGLVDVVALEGDDPQGVLEMAIWDGATVVLFDVLRDENLLTIGELIWKETAEGQLFVAGSSAVEYALTSCWRKSGVLPARSPAPPAAPPTPGIVVVSGSCSPVTERQIACAVKEGFAEVAIDTLMLAAPETRATAISKALTEAEPHFRNGVNVIFHTARGPKDSRLAATKTLFKSAGNRSAAVLGTGLGELLAAALKRSDLRRAVVTGGDTSSFAARALGVEALEFLAPMTPGSPLCLIHAARPPVDGCEIVFKGGQNGRDDFFLSVLDGGIQD